ncbi:MAG: DUF302 domain-containing protein [Rhodobacterales bacterium]|nr:DUF302 domain-containing protein [Rhodobacterales bacterium]
MRFLILFAVSVFFTNIVKAQTAILYNYEGTFDDATFSVEGAILRKGLVIDHISHTGDMLSRTANDVGSDIEIFKSADIFLFCSAAISRKVMEANPLNIAHCPYNIFVFENDNGVHIGHRSYPEGPMQIVHELLTDIISQALDF